MVLYSWNNYSKQEQVEMVSNSTYNDGSNRVHPVTDIISQESGNKANYVGNNVKEMVLGISFDYLIGKRATVED